MIGGGLAIGRRCDRTAAVDEGSSDGRTALHRRGAEAAVDVEDQLWGSTQQQHHYACRHVVVGLLVLLLAPLAAGDVLGHACGGMSYYTANSSYEESLELLAATLPRKAASSGALFATATSGSVPNAVHGLTQCRGDVDASTCDACVTAALEDARQLCAYDKDATVYYDRCVLRYSNQDFLLDSDTTDGFGTAVANSSATENDGDDGIVSSSPAAKLLFDADVSVLVNAVANYAANSPTRFATGVLQLAGGVQSRPRLFGLAQCTPDMAPTDCRTCLAYVIGFGVQKYSGRKTGTVHVLRCNYMYGETPFFSGGPLLRLRMPPPAVAPAPATMTQPPPASTTHHGKSKKRTACILAITLPVATAVLVLGSVLLLCCANRKRGPSLSDTFNPEGIKSIKSLAIRLSTLRAATGDFYIGNMIGQGGFGAVYKGILPPDNQEIAVKRLSQTSRQGIQELRNEIISVAKLRHRNIVRMVGVCLEGLERLIVYEYVPNGSLDKLIFDPQKRGQLGPEKVLTIIAGVARGLQYVHEDSQARIIHRDLKASNVLLDHELNPKISDFGLARILGGTQSHDITSRAAGTLGYMAPEYAASGDYSTKSDVYSFGILILEIATGKRNGGHHLLNLVWEHWEKGTVMDIIVGSSSLSSSSGDMLKRCVQIGLLCVQDSPADRPTVSAVNAMLFSSNTLPQPARARTPNTPAASSVPTPPTTQNTVSITELEPR